MNDKAQKSKAAAVKYRFQRFYPALHTGDYLTVQNKRQAPENVFFRQGDMDGACGLHVFSAVLVIFGLAKSDALHSMSRRKFGVPAEVWSVFQHTYFIGVDAVEFCDLVNSLNLPLNLTLREIKGGQLDRWVVDCAMAGELVAVVTANNKNPKHGRHWTLLVGVEGSVVGRETRSDTLLLLDPSASPPSYRPHNSRLRVPLTRPGSRAGKSVEQLYKPAKDRPTEQPIVWLHESADFATEATRIIAAVRFLDTEWS